MPQTMKPLPPDVTMEDLINHKHSRTYRQISKIFYAGEEASSIELAARTNMSLTSIWASLRAMKNVGLIYISRWEKSPNGGTNHTAVYKMGKVKDTPKPSPLQTTVRRTVNREKQIQRVQEKTPSPSIYAELAQALVPQRNEQEQHEINRLYLNWISEGTYG